MDNETKFCKDCKYGAFRMGSLRCFHEKNVEADIVYGVKSDVASPRKLREDPLKCGPVALWFDERPTNFKIESLIDLPVVQQPNPVPVEKEYYDDLSLLEKLEELFPFVYKHPILSTIMFIVLGLMLKSCLF